MSLNLRGAQSKVLRHWWAAHDAQADNNIVAFAESATPKCLNEGGLSFPDLKQREHINAAAQAANRSPDFSALIRAGRIGF